MPEIRNAYDMQIGSDFGKPIALYNVTWFLLWTWITRQFLLCYIFLVILFV